MEKQDMLQTTVLEEDSIKFVAMKRKYEQEIKQFDQFLGIFANTGKATWAVINAERYLRYSPSEERIVLK